MKLNFSEIKIKNFTCFFVIVAFFFVLSNTFSACTAEGDELKEDELKVYAINEGRFDLNENEYVTIQIVPTDSLDLLKIDNHTGGCLIGGIEFSLAYFNDNNWESISIDTEWNLLLIALNAGKTTNIKTDLLSFVQTYNKGKKGRYLLIKEFQLVTDRIEHEFISDVNLGAEFEIK